MVKAHNKREIARRIKAGDRFGVTTDEYTSLQVIHIWLGVIELHPT